MSNFEIANKFTAAKLVRNRTCLLLLSRSSGRGEFVGSF